MSRQGVVVENTRDYKVDSEAGRLTFKTHNVLKDGKVVFSTKEESLPSIVNTESYKTTGFKDIALNLCTLMSYSDAAKMLNRFRRQEEKTGTPSRTLENIVKVEGRKIETELTGLSEVILEKNDFDVEGTPKHPEKKYGLEKETARIDDVTLLVAVKELNVDLPENLQISTENLGFYEKKDCTTNVSIDAVCTKKQKESRKKTVDENEIRTENGNKEQLEKKTQWLYTTIAHIEQKGKQYVLSANNTVAIIPYLIAFLLKNNKMESHFQFFVDGEVSLQNTILSRFSFLSSFCIVLDWHHLEKKCKTELSQSIKGRDAKDKILNQIIKFLWYGHTDKAIEYLRMLDKDLLKAEKTVDRLVKYFERNKNNIPCYALRKHLGLRNSSNKGEKANDLSVSKRQKHKGMSWSENGSHSLTRIKVLYLNGEQNDWIKNKCCSFKFAA